MANLRILNINAADSRTIKVKFSDPLALDIANSNVQIKSEIFNIPDIEVVSVSVINDVLIINTLPHTPFSRYKVIFASTNSVIFRSLDESKLLLEDGRSNTIQILGAENDYNPTRSRFIEYLGDQDSVYDLSRESLVRVYLNQISDLINKCHYDIGQVKNSNYLEVTIQDERKIRRFGPWDRLDQEGAFEVLRVGKNPTNTSVSGFKSFTSFPSEPISLQSESITNEELILGIGSGTYDDLVLTLNRTPVIKLSSVQIKYSNGDIYNYDISQYGYQIKDPKYDELYGKRYVLLADNQVKLNDLVKDDPDFVVPGGEDTIVVSYEFKLLGKFVDTASVEVVEVVDVVREAAPALSVLFSLKNAPVVTSSDAIATSDGIEFLDPFSLTPFRSIHPAFLNEVPFREGSLPLVPGEFSIDYETGRVYVYGSVTNDGTGDFPPVMNYKYRKVYSNKLDYTYAPEFVDVVASPLRDLVGKTAKINYDYELTYVPGIDYNANVHIESRNERIENRLASLSSLYTVHAPITDVFRVYNETTGELYSLRRFTDNKIFFDYKTPPRIGDITRERAAFTDVFSESLILEQELYNTSLIRILKFRLLNQNIINNTEDAIGTSFNTSVTFSDDSIFVKEIYYDSQSPTQTESTNIDRLTSVGLYQVNYVDGIVYLAATTDQTLNVGTINYKKPVIKPQNSHVISVSDIYTSINANFGKSLTLDYSEFDEGEITPTSGSLSFSDERFTNNDTDYPYIYDGSNITVTNDIKSLRGIYDHADLLNNQDPINFVETATFVANVITLDSVGVSQTAQCTVGSDLSVVVPFISDEIEIGTVTSVIRVSDGYSFLDGYETITDNTILLNAGCGAVAGDVVNVLYTVVLQGGSTPVVDYNKGELFIDYSYLLDEIIVTYEWGDNVIDFRQSNTLNENDIYYVTYKVGALRNALTENFGSLVQIEELQVFDEDLDREVYRDILQGALQTFPQGPTSTALKQLVSSVTHIEPRIREAEFWSLAASYLNKVPSELLGEASLVAGLFDYGVLINNIGDGVTLPISNNLRLEEGTLELSVIPQWDGLDNDATVTFELYKDGYSLESSQVFIGATSFNPEIVDGKFSINRTDIRNPEGVPAAIFTAVGVFIHYDPFNKQWRMVVKDIPASDGYTYSGTITTSGDFYDVKFIEDLGDDSDMLRSGLKSVEFEFNLDGYDLATPDGYDGYTFVNGYSFDGIQFMSDNKHYLFDFGTNENQNRFSLYKDGRGYLVFEVWDRGGFAGILPDRRSVYQISADIQDWKAGQNHNLAISWILNSTDRRDEMHLFVDGFETPNNARYGNIPAIASSERFRTIVPEQVVGTITQKAIAGNDLVTTQDGYVVYSSTINFESEGVNVGDVIEILEYGFNTYTITSVNDNILELSSILPASLDDARFSINPVEFIVNTEIDIYKNIGVFVVRDGYEIEIPGNRADVSSYSIERNALNQRILKLLGNVEIGDTILIKTFGLNHRRCRDKAYLWSDCAILKTGLPPPVNLDDVLIKPIILPLVSVGPDNSTIVGPSFLSYLDGYSQPSTSLVDGYHLEWDGYLPNEGRRLEIRITGDNVDFSSPVLVSIMGTSSGGAAEVLSFDYPTKQITEYKWQEITSIAVLTTPLDLTIDSCAIEVKEAYSITEPDGNNYYPVIRFAYITQSGLSLESDGSDIVSDALGFFPLSEVNHILEISSPSSVRGIYQIIERIDNTTVRLDRVVGSAFTSGIYNCYDISIGRSGFQNGFFFLEMAGLGDIDYNLPSGWYEFDYATYLEVPFDPISQTGIIGNDITLQNPSKAVIDEFRILNRQLTDTRVGESIESNEYSITTDAFRISPFVKNSDTLTLLDFNNVPIINNSDVYKFANKEYIQSGTSVNSRFGHSIVIKDKGLVFSNEGYLDTSNEGIIEFWVSPRFDTYNDPNIRVYFDAAASVVEEVVSNTKGSLTTSGRIREVLYIRLESDTNLKGTNYAEGCSIGSDGKTITLKTPLPFQNTPIKVSYIPTSLQGDRLTIAKDSSGFICFTVTAQGQEFQVRQPVFWPRDSWHRVKASFKFNTITNLDEIRLFVDGEERGAILFGQNDLLFGQGLIWGQAAIGGVTNKVYIADINFTDTIIQFSLGQDYAGNFGAEARFDNFKISNRATSPLVVSGQPVDIDYNTNIDFVYPAVTDAFTTFLYDFDSAVEKTEDFAVVQDPIYGLFKFDIDIIDSFNIVTGDERVRTVLEALIYALKPAVSKVGIHYIT